MASDKAAPPAGWISALSAELPEFRVGYLGYGIYWAWVFVSFNSAVLFSSVSNAAVSVLKTHQISIAASIAAVIAMVVVARLISPLSRHRWALFAMCAVASIGTFTTVLAGRAVIGPAWLVVGSVMTGVGTTWLGLSWGERYGTIGARSATIHTTASMVLASVLYFLIVNTVPAVAVPLTIGLPVLSAVLLIPNSNGLSQRPQFSASISRLLTSSVSWRILAGIGIVSFALGVMRPLTASTDTAVFGAVSQIPIISGGAAALLIGLGAVLFSRRFNLGFAYRIALPLIAIGFMLLALLGREHGTLSSVAVSTGGECFEMLTWIVLADVTFRTRVPAILVFGLGRFALQIGMLIGELTGGAFFTQLTPLALIMLFTLLIAAVFILNERNIFDVGEHEGLEQAAAGDEAEWTRKLAQITAEYGLSPREHEILVVWAKGRRIEYLEEKFHISKNTAKTHVSHIYRKIGVHTREDLLALIEQTTPAGRANGN